MTDTITTLDDRVDHARTVISHALRSGRSAVVAASFGKDSSAVLNLMRTTAADLRA